MAQLPRGIREIGEVDTFDEEGISSAKFTLAADPKSSHTFFEAHFAEQRFSIYPFKIASQHQTTIETQFGNLREIRIAADFDEDERIDDWLEGLSWFMSQDANTGIRVERPASKIVQTIVSNTNCTILDLTQSAPSRIEGNRFIIPRSEFETAVKELKRIRSRGSNAVDRVQRHVINNRWSTVLNRPKSELSLGRLPDSQWMSKVASGEQPLGLKEQKQVATWATEVARQMSGSQTRKLAKMQFDIQIAGMEQFLVDFEDALEANHKEAYWQNFLSNNEFTLQLLFGGPTELIGEQVDAGATSKTRKGRRSLDFLLKNGITNNVTIVEIKRPSTELVDKIPYRTDLYRISDEIAGSITQVLDQSKKLVATETDTMARTKDLSARAIRPRCFVVAGTMKKLAPKEIDDFELFRSSIGAVQIITFDELFQQVKNLYDYLKESAANEDGTL